jgi:dTDP-4-amino-4,6-dideoxygalactose transaminase
MKMIANDGGRKKYHSEVVGVNSRVGSVQGAVLRVKLQYLEAYTKRRRTAADRYDELLADLSDLETPYRAPERRHVFHQYTVRLTGADRSDRDRLTDGLSDRGIPYSVYYPRPLHELPVFQKISDRNPTLPEAERASRQVVSLPMHTELEPDHQERVAEVLSELIEELDVQPVGAG